MLMGTMAAATPRRLTAEEIARIRQHDDAWTRAFYKLALDARHVPGPLGDLGSFWSNPLKSIHAFISHPAKTIAHDFTAKKIVQTAKTVAPIAAGAAALYFGAPYLASALGTAGSTVGSYITSNFPTLSSVGSTAYKWWSQQGHNAAQYVHQLANTPAIQTAADRAGASVPQMMNFLQQHAANMPPSVAAGGQGQIAQYLAEQALMQHGIGLQTPAAQGLMNQRIAAEQATMGAAQAGYLPSNAAQPGAAPVVPATKKPDWTKYALVGIAGTGLVISAMRQS